VPTADEASVHGVELGAMQVSLLEKIEEITLHLISQEKEIQRLRDRVEFLERTTELDLGLVTEIFESGSENLYLGCEANILGGR
jgi:hypothetical protein